MGSLEDAALVTDLIAFVKDFYRDYEPVSDVNEETEKMVARAKALIERHSASQKTAEDRKAQDDQRSDRLREFFGTVCSKENWKMPINAVIKAEDEAVAIDAIIFMTGGGDITVTQSPAQKKKGLIRIQAPGYYATVGA